MQVISESQQMLEHTLAISSPDHHDRALMDQVAELQEQLETVEREKTELLQSTLAELVEHRAKEKEQLARLV